MKTKILYVITKGNWGGAQKYVFEMANRLPKDQFEATVACGVGDILPQKLESAGVPVIKIARLGRDVNVVKDTLVFFDLIQLFRRARPDVVHLNSSKIGGLGALAARIARIKKIVFTVHGFAFNENRSWISKKIIAFLSWLTIVFSTDVIFISETEMKRALSWPFIKQKASLIYNGIEKPAFLPRESARKELAKICNFSEALYENRTVIGTIAELTHNKGLTYAIKAIGAVPNSLFIIIGRGELENELKALIKEEELEEKVFLAGFVQDASRFDTAFDIFMLSSLKEGMPYVLMEAGLAALPVVTTPVGGIPEIVTDTVSGLFAEPRSAQTLSSKIIEYMNNVELARQCGQNLEQHIRNTFTVDKMTQNTYYLYQY